MAAGDALLSPSVTRRLIERFADIPEAPDTDAELGRLAEREREVLTCVARGFTDSEIATRMHISESTARTHFKRVLMKLQPRDRVAAVVLVYEIGLVRPGARPPGS